ncbi:hypothetical protein AMTRI_Chr01g128920 [Amborella trichopoda]
MVCQAAGKARFRALKHYEENGRATIVVRVIACFQPLQGCQEHVIKHMHLSVRI